MNEFENFIKKINDAKNIVIFTHTIPDGDAIGSSFGLASALKKLNKNVCVVLQDKILDEYTYFNLDEFLKYEVPENVDLMISTDCPILDRIGKFSAQFKDFPNTVAIDHHISFESFAKLNYVNSNSSSACEFLYDIFNECRIPIDKQVAEFIYLGILRDTGGFMHSSTTPSTFRATADLLEKGVDLENINRHFMLTTTLKTTLLLKTALENLIMSNYGKIAISTISSQELKQNNAKVENTGGIIGNLLAINTVEVAILITEVQPNVHKVSIRTKKLDANDIAKDFGGGGHKKASGCQMYGQKNKVLNALLKSAESRLLKSEEVRLL